MNIDNLTFLNEEIVVKKLKASESEDPFTKSVLVHEKDNYILCEVIKVGNKQQEITIGDKVLINQNGLSKELNIDGYGVLENTYVLPTQQRILCTVNE